MTKDIRIAIPERAIKSLLRSKEVKVSWNGTAVYINKAQKTHKDELNFLRRQVYQLRYRLRKSTRARKQ
jgi:hypothetical protein